MRDNHALYYYSERKMDSFGWIMIFYILASVFLFCVFMVIGPIELVSRDFNFWTLLLLLVVPLGAFLAIKIIGYARGLIWHNNHLTSYSFYPRHIEIQKWEKTYERDPSIVKIELTSIQKVVFAPYIVNEYRTQHGNTRIDSNTILYIVKLVNGKRELFMLEFPAKDDQVNIWLKYFHEQRIPVFFTNEVLYRKDRKTMGNEERIKALDADNLLLSVPYGVEWKQLRKELQNEWNKQFPGLNGFGSKPVSIPMNPNRSRWGFGFNTVAVFGPMFLITYLLIKLVENEILATVHFLPIVIILLLGGLLYFYLIRNRLRWFHLLFYIGKVFLFSFAWLISIEETEEAIYQVVENITVISVFFPLVAWIPYLIVKRIGNNKTK